jgi:hypothetical protein
VDPKLLTFAKHNKNQNIKRLSYGSLFFGVPGMATI